MASIGDLFFGVKPDMSGFESEVQSKVQGVGDRASQTMGQRIGGGLRRAAPAIAAGVGAVVVGAFAAGTTQLVALDTAMANFRAETGATEDEVKSAADSVLEFSRNNLQGIDEIARAQAALRTDLGLSQEAAEDATQSFLDYATATNQDAADGVRQFDDILDAWNLDASESQGLMDKLIASHQQYGGDVGANADALAKLAPQLQGMNLGVDEGIGLLNLFAASGLDAQSASTALNTAIRNLEPGQTFDDLIKEISSIEDPTKRSQRAIEIFGSRGGVSLAQALRPGIDSLDDFTISQEEAQGKTEAAADAINDSWTNRVKIWIGNVAGLSAQFLQNFGPAIGGVAAIIPVLGGPLGGLFKMMSGGAISAIPQLMGGLKLLGGSFTTLAFGPIGIIVGAVAGLFLAWQTNFLGIQDIVKNVFGWITDVALPWITGVFGTIVDVISGAIGTIAEVIGSIIDVISGVVETIVGVYVAAFEVAFNAIKAVIETIVGIITGIIGGIADVVGTVASVVGGFFDFITGGSSTAKQQINSVSSATPSGQFNPANQGGTRPPGYALGAWAVPNTGLAYLHADEMVVPPGPAQALRDWFGGGFASLAPAAAGAGGDVINVNVNGLMRARSTSEVGAGLRRLSRAGALTKRRRFTDE